MDSRLIAGAYSQHFRALEREQLEDNEKRDSATKARRLSQETNKRRKFQAQKRKLEAQREERRRQDILTKRREEQKQATERYQRSHIPAGSRQNSGRSSPRKGSPRRQLVPGLEDALRLIRKNPLYERSNSGKEQLASFNNENEDPMKRAYISSQVGHNSVRPSSGRSIQAVKYEPRAQLMDYSMKNLTSSKSLFEQQLEQQQLLLLEQQQKSFKEFNAAVQKELDSAENGQYDDGSERDEESGMKLSDSCSSIDSLEKSYGSDQKPASWMNSTGHEAQDQLSAVPADHNGQFYLNQNSSCNQNLNNNTSTLQEPNHVPLNIDLTPSATFQRTHPPLKLQEAVPGGGAPASENDNNSVFQTEKSHREPDKFSQPSHQNIPLMAQFQMPLKQISTDSLAGSESSDSSISLVKIPDNNAPAPMQGISIGHQSKGNSLSDCQASPSKQMVNHNDSKTDKKHSYDPHSLPSSHEQTGSSAGTMSPSCRKKADPVIEPYNPRYASAIGLSIWPGQTSSSSGSGPDIVSAVSSAGNSITNGSSVNNGNNLKSPVGTRSASIALVGPMSSAVSGTLDRKISANSGEDGQMKGPMPSPVSPSSQAENNINIPKNEPMSVFNQLDFTYPLSQSSIQGQTSQNPGLPPSQASVYNTLQAEISQLSKQMSQNNPGGLAYPQQYHSSASHFSQPSIPSVSHASCALGSIPIPAVRTIFPVNRPPVPSTNVGLNEVGKKNSSQERSNFQVEEREMPQDKEVNGTIEMSEETQHREDEKDKDSNAEFTKPLKGILKQLPPKGPSHGQPNNRVQVRDSVELTRLQNEKKQAKKKSVRFAEHHTEESFDDSSEQAMTQTGLHFAIKNSYKQPMIRPTSAKVVSTTGKPDLSTKPARASSAGTRRPQASVTTTQADSSGSRVNLPANVVQPLNTPAPINRPKAAAHIIMSSDFNSPGKTAETGPHSPPTHNPMTVHKSQLEAKVKTVNNNFMSKVPMRNNGAKGGNSTMVYHAMRHGNSAPSLIGGGTCHVMADGTQYTQNGQYEKESSFSQPQPHQPSQLDKSRIREPLSKRVPLSNNSMMRTSTVPASTKINYPATNSSTPSYSVSGTQGSDAAVFDENGLRVDRTPTDEEITWLWDKVRNCLDKEEDRAGSKQVESSGPQDQTGRPTPVLSTKLIDGASLGFNSSGAAGLRPGSGYFYPRANSANAGNASQNKAKPVVQQQGSYLRRYGLLQQRRTNSASSIPSAVHQARTGSAGFVKYSTVPTSQQSQQQVHEADMPTPMAFSYRPQDNVSESTAAFVMAERLVKQSLTDSHVNLGMDDAQAKQEMHNKNKTGIRTGGPSALSLEEQKLMESLDRLNDKLKDPKYSGTIHFHQPYQSHLPGFRGHQGLSDSRRQGVPNTIQPRTQSARIRQQIRQYR